MEEKTMNPEGETGFDQFSLSHGILKSIEEMGYLIPTEVQAQTIPKVFAGKDLIVQSRTGTGKTAAYGIPVLELIDPGMLLVQALVLTPTRELALQVGEELSRIGKDRRVRSLTVYGGDSMDRQIEGIREGAQVIIGTPGRILDHLKRKTLSFSSVKTLVLDEADRMLDMGFYRDMKMIFDYLPARRQTLLFSATFPKEIDALTYNYLNEPERLLLSQDYVYVKEVEHIYYITNQMHKERNLFKLLVTESPAAAMIFCNTRAETRQVFQYLWKRGVPLEMLSSDLPQKKRERVMESLRRKEVRFLVTTDVAARGIDIQDLSHVFIFSTPSSPDQYVHRAGRTGRAGKSGKAITLLGATDLIHFNRMVKTNELQVTEADFPSDEAVQEILGKKRMEELVIRSRSVLPEDRQENEGLARAVLERKDVRLQVLTMLLRDYQERQARQEQKIPESAGAIEESGRVPRRGAPRGRPGGRSSRRPGAGPGIVSEVSQRVDSPSGTGRRRRPRRRRSSSGGTRTGAQGGTGSGESTGKASA